MYTTIKRLYHEDKIDESGLDNAIKKGWITDKEKVDIMTEKV